MIKQNNYSAAADFEKEYTTGTAIFDRTRYTYKPINDLFGYAYIGMEPKAMFMKQAAFYDEYLQPKIVGAPLAKKFKEAEQKRLYTETLYLRVGWHSIKHPDGVIYNIETNTIYIIEVKYQTPGSKGSVHEKILGAEGLKYLYDKAASKLNTPTPTIKLLYIVNKYLVDEYPDDFDYLSDIGIDYFVEQFPDLSYFGL